MGSRYGRNKKRKHIEAISLLNEAVTYREQELNKLSNIHSKLIHDVEYWNDEIMHIIRQQYSAFSIGTQEIAVRHFHELEYVNEPAPLAVFLSLDQMPDNFFYNPIRLVRFLCELSEEQLHDVRRIIRLRISNGKQLGYAINIEHLHLIKNDPKFKEFLAKNIAIQFSAML